MSLEQYNERQRMNVSKNVGASLSHRKLCEYYNLSKDSGDYQFAQWTSLRQVSEASIIGFKLPSISVTCISSSNDITACNSFTNAKVGLCTACSSNHKDIVEVTSKSCFTGHSLPKKSLTTTTIQNLDIIKVHDEQNIRDNESANDFGHRPMDLSTVQQNETIKESCPATCRNTIEQSTTSIDNSFDYAATSGTSSITTDMEVELETRKESTCIKRHGRWTQEECELFVHYFSIYKRNFQCYELLLQTRTKKQLRSHCQKYVQKLAVEENLLIFTSGQAIVQQKPTMNNQTQKSIVSEDDFELQRKKLMKQLRRATKSHWRESRKSQFQLQQWHCLELQKKFEREQMLKQYHMNVENKSLWQVHPFFLSLLLRENNTIVNNSFPTNTNVPQPMTTNLNPPG
jgi:hypothetical protein